MIKVPKALIPNGSVDRTVRKAIVVAWIGFVAIFWVFSPSPFLPRFGEVLAATQSLWLYEDLGTSLIASMTLNLESIAIATAISLGLAYMGTIPAFRPLVSFVGKLRFLSLAGLGFAFTLMTTSGQQLKISVLVFMVVVYFVVSMADSIEAIPKEQYDLATTLRHGPWGTLYEVVILGQADQAFIMLRQTAAMSWMFVSTAEGMSMSGGGIGSLLNTSSKHFHLAEIMALQIIVLILGLFQDYAIGWLRVVCCPWVVREAGK